MGNKCGFITVATFSTIASIANLFVGSFTFLLSGVFTYPCYEENYQMKEQFNEFEEEADKYDGLVDISDYHWMKNYIFSAAKTAKTLCYVEVYGFGSISIVSGVLWLIVAIL